MTWQTYAHGQIHVAVRAGKIKRQPCEVCGAVRVHAHHDDYSKPLVVRWLCPQHHREHHRLHGSAISPSGNPPKRIGTLTESLRVRLNETQWQAVRALARTEGRSVGDVVRQAFTDYLAKESP